MKIDTFVSNLNAIALADDLLRSVVAAFGLPYEGVGKAGESH
jgi:hypothetical protein